MVRLPLLVLLATVPAALAADPGPEASPLLHKSWYELNSGNFRVFSCAINNDVTGSEQMT